LLGAARADATSQHVSISESIGDHWSSAWTRKNLADVHLVLDQPEHAAELYRRALQFTRAVGDRQGVAFILNNPEQPRRGAEPDRPAG